MIYKSKISYGFIALLIVVLGGSTVLMITEALWIGLPAVLLAAAFFMYAIKSTCYIIQRSTLKVRCGILVHKSINVKSIRRVVETHNTVAAPATSLDRLCIEYNDYDTIHISPRDKHTFVRHLKEINPAIAVEAAV